MNLADWKRRWGALTLAFLRLIARIMGGDYALSDAVSEADYRGWNAEKLLSVVSEAEARGMKVDYNLITLVCQMGSLPSAEASAAAQRFGARIRWKDNARNRKMLRDIVAMADGHDVDLYYFCRIFSLSERKASRLMRASRKNMYVLRVAFGVTPEPRTEHVRRLRTFATMAKRAKLSLTDTYNVLSYVFPYIRNADVAGARAEFSTWMVNNGKAMGGEDINKRGDTMARMDDRRWRRLYDGGGSLPSFPGSWRLMESSRRGSKLADLAFHAIGELMREHNATGRPIVVYGRDCEVFYLLMREFHPTVPASYVLAPRPLTTEGGAGRKSEAYKAYIRKHVPPNAIHFDSGFSGTIPSWIRDKMGIPLGSVRLISSSLSNRTLFGEASVGGDMRKIVIDDIEHVPHRLREASNGCWGAWEFDTEGDNLSLFWSRMFGLREGYRAILSGSRAPKSLRDISGRDWTPRTNFDTEDNPSASYTTDGSCAHCGATCSCCHTESCPNYGSNGDDE